MIIKFHVCLWYSYVWLETFFFGLFSWPLFRVELGAVAEPPCHPAGHRGPHGTVSGLMGKSG